jgi:hypothetical protein
LVFDFALKHDASDQLELWPRLCHGETGFFMLHCIESRLMQVSWQCCEETAATRDHAPVDAAG